MEFTIRQMAAKSIVLHRATTLIRAMKILEMSPDDLTSLALKVLVRIYEKADQINDMSDNDIIAEVDFIMIDYFNECKISGSDSSQ